MCTVCEGDIGAADEVGIMGVATQLVFVVGVLPWPVHEGLRLVLVMSDVSAVETEDEGGDE